VDQIYFVMLNVYGALYVYEYKQVSFLIHIICVISTSLEDWNNSLCPNEKLVLFWQIKKTQIIQYFTPTIAIFSFIIKHYKNNTNQPSEL